MRNLKKFLALVLAMVMAFSLMLSASAADVKYDDYKDKDSVTSEFVEAVSVLTGLKVVQGDGEEGNKNFRPKDNITRAEAAAMVYRIATGDVAGTQERLYSDYGKFTDVNSGDWFAGYVGYCQNAGIIKGTSPTTFNPYGKVTGYEVLAMILRAVGYGQNNEFTGPTWQVNVASMGKTKHITDSVVSDHFAYTLNMPATREIVAELLFRGSMIPQVTWTQIGGYNERTTLLGTEGWNATLMTEVFGLYDDGWKQDTWGRPQFVWKADKNPSTDRTVATLKANYTEAFHDEKRECDVAELMEFGTSASKDYILYVNGKTAVTDKYHIVATDTVTRVGGYGRQVEIYTQEDMDKQFPWHSTWNYYNNAHDEATRVAPADTIVMVDTYLAKVVNKTEAVKDPAGHVITPARLIVDLYDANNTVPFDKAASANVPNRRTISKPATSDASWEFAIGDVISLNGLSSNTTVGASKNEQWAYTLPQVAVPSTNILTENTNVFNLTKLDGVQAKQTTVYWNNGKQQVAGEDKTDALALRMDKAGTNIDTTYTWYYDQYGYLLGIDDGGKVNYGVITSIYVSYGTNEAVDTNGVAKAIATVKYADGTTGTETIDYFLVSGTNTDNSNRATNVYDEMDETDTATGNVVQLWPVYNVSSIEPMDANNQKMPFGSAAPSPRLGVSQGAVYMAPVAASNAQAAAGKPATLNLHGILYHNLFKFVKSAGDKTVAVEVAGGGQTYTGPSINVGSNVAGHWAATNTAGKVYKSLAYITTASGGATNANVVAWLDNDSQIMIRDKSTGSIACYDGVSALPGNVTIDAAADNHNYNEIDWADTDGDGRADVVYLTGTIEGVTSYGLFYTNDQSAQWNGTTATISGFLNGEQTTLTFTSLAEFNKIKNNSYAGHLYAVKKVGDVVTNVLSTDWAGTKTTQLLNNSGASGTLVKTFNTGAAATNGAGISVNGAGADNFQYGTATGFIGTNPYTNATEAIYWRDVTATTGSDARVVYKPGYNWSNLGGTVEVTNNYDSAVYVYHLNPNSKVYGLGSNVVLAEGETALEYLNHSNINSNDVTIIYENNAGSGATATMSILEMYIQTDPNWTPSNPTAPYAVTGNVTNLTTDNSTTLGNTLANGTPNTVVYSPNAKNPAGLGGTNPNALDSSQPAGNLLYFPYTAPAGTYVLRIYDASNTLIYSGNPATVTDGGLVSASHATGSQYAHGFVFDITNRTNTGVGSALTRGSTYTFRITSNTSPFAQVSAGSFTLN